VKDKKIDRNKEKFKKFSRGQITEMFTAILDYTEVAVGDPQRHKILRGKILRVANDAIRNIDREVDERYDLKYIPPSEDIIYVNINRGRQQT
jgi:hypothetical protein